MSRDKHLRSGEQDAVDLRDNLEHDPGISRSKGRFAMTDEPPLDGESTFEGDVKNDTTPQGGIDPAQRGRTNK